ncbi:hypothetical protein [Acidihalobacter prosperus]
MTSKSLRPKVYGWHKERPPVFGDVGTGDGGDNLRLDTRFDLGGSTIRA